MPIREHYIFVCVNRRPPGHPTGSCAEKGSEDVLAALKESLVRRGLAKELARACGTSCLDMCGDGVAVVVEPEHVVYGGVRREHADSIVEAIQRNEVVEALVVRSRDSDSKVPQ